MSYCPTRIIWIVALLAFLVAGPAGAVDSANGSDELGQTEDNPPPSSRHRIDIGATFVDGQSANLLNGTVGYTYNLTSKSNINLSVPYLDPDTNTGNNSGFGDAVLSYSYVPSATISAHPWVPRTIGTGVAVLMPTGDANAGRSLDAWIIAPYVGVVVPLARQAFFAPQAGYVHSLDETVGGTDLRLAFVETGFGFVSDGGFWTSYFPQFVRDLETDEWVVNHRFAVGKMLSQTFGISLDYSIIERFNFGSNVPPDSGSDEQIDLSVHFNF